MKNARSAAGLFGLAMLFWLVDVDLAQPPPPGFPRPPGPPPPVAVQRALPAEETPEPPPIAEAEQPEKRQLEYASGLFARKLYDLAAPEFQKYLDDYPGASGRAQAYMSLGECYRNLNKLSNARNAFQKVLNDYAESEFAGPAAYALARSRSFIAQPRNRRTPQSHCRPAISKRAVSKRSITRMKLATFTNRSRKRRIRIHFAKMRARPLLGSRSRADEKPTP